MEYPEIHIRWDPENLDSYEVIFEKVQYNQGIAVLRNLIEQMEEQVEVGQTEQPELNVTPIPGGNDDILN